jgi:hypothetical protein
MTMILRGLILTFVLENVDAVYKRFHQLSIDIKATPKLNEFYQIQ